MTVQEQVDFDVIIVGAGLSGIDAAWHLQQHSPNKSFTILESREQIGGTWDLFRYPGIRSDSDMYTMGYSFRPWTHPSSISPGDVIRQYICDTARDAGIDRLIRFQHKVESASWCSQQAKWTLQVRKCGARGAEERLTFTTRFLLCCAGFYRYDAGYTPEFAGRDRFCGQIVHPQQWPEDLDYSGKQVVVIGSGATAVTLLPALAKSAGLVTMLQRSPTYYITRPEKDWLANFLRWVLPAKWAYAVPRWKNIVLQRLFFTQARRKPDQTQRILVQGVKKRLGPKFTPEDFTPRYKPWDQRLCVVPNGDMFKAIRSGKATIVTDEIETFDADGIQLKSGKHLKADIIVTATGLQLQILGGMKLSVDEQQVDLSKLVIYKGIMYSNVPNLAVVFGYTSASWTLRADLVCQYICRLLNHMDSIGMQIATPKLPATAMAQSSWLNLTSGYIRRSAEHLPKQGDMAPWRQNQSYFKDLREIHRAPIEDTAIEFSNPTNC